MPGTLAHAPDLPPYDPRTAPGQPGVLLGALALAALYLAIVGPWRRRLGGPERFAAGRAATFLAGVLVMAAVLSGPVHWLSDYYLFSVHMAQHLLLTQVVAPLLLLGLPSWLVARGLARPGVARALGFWGSPLVGGGAFIVVIVFWHLAPFYDLMMRNRAIHVGTHVLFVGTALLAWWPVCCPVDRARPREPVQMLYLFLLGIPMQIVAAAITLSDRVLYPWYASAPRTFGLSPLDDQQLGGLIMWVPGGLGLWIAITGVWLAWAKKNRRMPSARGDGDEEPPLTLPGG